MIAPQQFRPSATISGLISDLACLLPRVFFALIFFDVIQFTVPLKIVLNASSLLPLRDFALDVLLTARPFLLLVAVERFLGAVAPLLFVRPVGFHFDLVEVFAHLLAFKELLGFFGTLLL